MPIDPELRMSLRLRDALRTLTMIRRDVAALPVPVRSDYSKTIEALEQRARILMHRVRMPDQA